VPNNVARVLLGCDLKAVNVGDKTATNTATAGGGILSSSARRFTLAGPNDEVERRGAAVPRNGRKAASAGMNR
jgi:hypothetical protein